MSSVNWTLFPQAGFPCAESTHWKINVQAKLDGPSQLQKNINWSFLDWIFRISERKLSSSFLWTHNLFSIRWIIFPRVFSRELRYSHLYIRVNAHPDSVICIQGTISCKSWTWSCRREIDLHSLYRFLKHCFSDITFSLSQCFWISHYHAYLNSEFALCL